MLLVEAPQAKLHLVSLLNPHEYFHKRRSTEHVVMDTGWRSVRAAHQLLIQRGVKGIAAVPVERMCTMVPHMVNRG